MDADLEVGGELVAVAAAHVDARPPAVLAVGVPGQPDGGAERLEPSLQQPGDLPGERRLRVAAFVAVPVVLHGFSNPPAGTEPVDPAREAVVAELVTRVDHDDAAGQRQRRGRARSRSRRRRRGSATRARPAPPASPTRRRPRRRRTTAYRRVTRSPGLPGGGRPRPAPRRWRRRWTARSASRAAGASRSTLAKAPTASPGRGGASVTGTSCPKTRSKAATSSRTVTPVAATDVDRRRWASPTSASTSSKRSTARTWALARSHTWR